MIRYFKTMLTSLVIFSLVLSGPLMVSSLSAGDSKKCEKHMKKFARLINKRTQIEKAIRVTGDKIQEDPGEPKWRKNIEKLMANQDKIEEGMRKETDKLGKYCD